MSRSRQRLHLRLSIILTILICRNQGLIILPSNTILVTPFKKRATKKSEEKGRSLKPCSLSTPQAINAPAQEFQPPMDLPKQTNCACHLPHVVPSFLPHLHLTHPRTLPLECLRSHLSLTPLCLFLSLVKMSLPRFRGQEKEKAFPLRGL